MAGKVDPQNMLNILRKNGVQLSDAATETEILAAVNDLLAQRSTPGNDSDELMANTTAYQQSLVESNATVQAEQFVKAKLSNITVDYDNYPMVRRHVKSTRKMAMTKYRHLLHSEHALQLIDQVLVEGLTSHLGSTFRYRPVDIDMPLQKVLDALDDEYLGARGAKAEKVLAHLITEMPTTFAELENYCKLVYQVRSLIINDSPQDRLPKEVFKKCHYTTWEQRFENELLLRFANNPNALSLLNERSPKNLDEYAILCRDLCSGTPAQKYVLENAQVLLALHTVTGKTANPFVKANSAQTTPASSQKKSHGKKKSKNPPSNQQVMAKKATEENPDQPPEEE